MANIRLRDVVVEITPGGADDGAFTAGTSVIVCADEFSATVSNGLVNTACGQDEIAWMRTGQTEFDVNITGKIPTDGAAAGEFLETIWDNSLFQAEFTYGGGVYTFVGILDSHTPVQSADAPTWNLRLAAYGTVPTQAPAV